jgi:outer membrane protein assembly factor BamB
MITNSSSHYINFDENQICFEPMRTEKTILICCIAFIVSCFQLSGQSGWPQFRGPSGSGICREKNPLPAELNPERNLLWKCSVSEGVSSLCVAGDKIFLTGRRGDSLETICIDRNSGRMIWSRLVIPEKIERVHPVSNPASCTPASDGELVFSYFGSYGLIAYDFAGTAVWERRVPQEGNMYGTAVSPILFNGKLIFSRDADRNSFLEVLNPKTGETIWKKDRADFKANWSTPMVAEVNGTDQLIVYGIWWMKAYDLKDGTELWSFPGLTDEPIITPVYGNGLIFITSYNMKTNPEVIGLPAWDSLLQMYDVNRDSMLAFEEIKTNRSILSRYDDDGDGDHPLPGFFSWLDADKNGFITQKEWGKIIKWVDGFPQENALIALRPAVVPGTDPTVAWRYTFGVPECPSPLSLDGLVYMLADGGLITCLGAESGKLVYASKLGSGGAYYASPVYGDGKIFCASARGVVTVLNAGPEMKILSRNDLKERILATPAITGGRIYIRTAGGLYAFGL